MGEAKRRKKLDLGFGKKPKSTNLSTKSSKKNQDSLSQGQINSFEKKDVLLSEQDNLKFTYFDEDDLEEDDENESLTSLSVRYEYEAKGKMPEGKTVSQSGKAEFSRSVREDQFDDDGIIFGEALQSAMEHLYIFGFEKQGHTQVSEVTITIKNLTIRN